MLHFEIKGTPPSNNQYIGQNGKNWQYSRVKKQWLQIIQYATLKIRPPKPFKKSKVTISYYFKDNRRRDPDNYSGKMILDALTKCGIIEDDSFDNIELIIRKAGCDKANPRTIIEVKEVTDE